MQVQEVFVEDSFADFDDLLGGVSARGGEANAASVNGSVQELRVMRVKGV